MAIGSSLQFILANYRRAIGEPFSHHSVARFIRNEAAQAVQAGLEEWSGAFSMVGSAGAGNWASVPYPSEMNAHPKTLIQEFSFVRRRTGDAACRPNPVS